MNSLLTLSNVHKSYTNHTALSDFNMTVPANSIFGLLGPNGAGKTTLIRIINRIIEVDKGTIYFGNERLQEHHLTQIGYLPEERGLYKKMKVGQQLVYFGQLRGLSRHDAKQRAVAWCQKLEIDTWWQHKIQDLSKGMAQKIQFIATVMHEPQLLILDEPFSGFDPINAALIRDEILSLHQKGATVIFSTHQMESVEELCDYIVMINKSEKILDGTKTAIKNQFREGKYDLEYVGELSPNSCFSVIKTEAKSEHINKSLLVVNEGYTTNQLLNVLVKYVDILSFSPRIPSMRDIFITKVNRST